MPHIINIPTKHGRPGLEILRARRVDWPLADDTHLPRPGTKEREIVDCFATLDRQVEHLGDWVSSVYEVLDGDGQALGVCIKMTYAGYALSGEWLVYRQGRRVMDSTERTRTVWSLAKGACELARREHKSIRNWSTRRRTNAADRAALDGLVPYA